MSRRFQRLIVILLSLIFFILAIFLVLSSSKDNIIFFYTPSELIESQLENDEKVRIGGFVKKNSIKTKEDNKHRFIITDNKKNINIIYEGMLPDLFREEQGVVIEGRIINKNTAKASIVFAKHDENYIPANIKDELENNGTWKKDYK